MTNARTNPTHEMLDAGAGVLFDYLDEHGPDPHTVAAEVYAAMMAKRDPLADIMYLAEERPGPINWAREKWAQLVGRLQFWWKFGRHG